MKDLLRLIQDYGYSRSDAKKLVKLYPEIAARMDPRAAAAEIIAKRAERFTEDQPDQYIIVRRPEPMTEIELKESSALNRESTHLSNASLPAQLSTSGDVLLAKQVSIRDAGLDEYWLQDQIYENPACLGLGELDALAKERKQASGGRLDVLLKNALDDSMFEVEIMLGETDETHIIRTIEYWDNEKRRWPQRQHFAVLVAEHINRRFFNVIHLLSYSIPIIAVQVALLEISGKRSLYFSTILDTYEEIEDGESLDEPSFNREFWVKKAKWTLETADALFAATQDIFDEPALSYVKSYVAINVSRYNYLWLHKRSENKSLLGFRMSPHLQEEAATLLDSQSITYVKKPKRFLTTVDKAMIENKRDVFRSIAELVKKTWEDDG